MARNNVTIWTSVGPQNYLAARRKGHLTPNQSWVRDGKTYWFAHTVDRAAGLRQTNRFFFKHFLLPSKSGTALKDKLENRLRKRYLPIDMKKEPREGGGMTAFQKYGAGEDMDDNTAVNFDLISPYDALTAFVNAIGAEAGWNNGKSRDVLIVFPKACISDETGVDTDRFTVSIRKINANVFDIYHLC